MGANCTPAICSQSKSGFRDVSSIHGIEGPEKTRIGFWGLLSVIENYIGMRTCSDTPLLEGSWVLISARKMFITITLNPKP